MHQDGARSLVGDFLGGRLRALQALRSRPLPPSTAREEPVNELAAHRLYQPGHGLGRRAPAAGCQARLTVQRPAGRPEEVSLGALDGRAPFPSREALLFVGAAGIAVRAVAPHLRKQGHRTRRCWCVDERGSFCHSHWSRAIIGGANDLALPLGRAAGCGAGDHHRHRQPRRSVRRGHLGQSPRALAIANPAGDQGASPPGCWQGSPCGLCSDLPIAGRPRPQGCGQRPARPKAGHHPASPRGGRQGRRCTLIPPTPGAGRGLPQGHRQPGRPGTGVSSACWQACGLAPAGRMPGGLSIDLQAGRAGPAGLLPGAAAWPFDHLFRPAARRAWKGILPPSAFVQTGHWGGQRLRARRGPGQRRRAAGARKTGGGRRDHGPGPARPVTSVFEGGNHEEALCRGLGAGRCPVHDPPGARQALEESRGALRLHRLHWTWCRPLCPGQAGASPRP